jgi:arylformamidase
VVINYRLSPKVQHPEHILDVTRAFAWTVRNVSRYGGDPEHIFVCGHSAGAHLVSLMTVDKRYLEEHKLSTKNICGVIPVSGIFEIPDGLFTMVFGEDPEKRRQASPLLQARGGLPPFLFLYADADLPYCDRPAAEAFCKALKDKGTSATTREIAMSNHYTMVTSLARQGDPVSTAIIDFIKAHPSKG